MEINYASDSDGSIVMKTDGKTKLNFINVCALLYEIDLYTKWIPHLDYSEKVRQKSKMALS